MGLLELKSRRTRPRTRVKPPRVRREEREVFPPYMIKGESKVLGGPFILAENVRAAQEAPPEAVVFLPRDISLLLRLGEEEARSYYRWQRYAPRVTYN